MAAESIIIGDACMIAHGVYISDADWHGIYAVSYTHLTLPTILLV